jgi:hypothetical protein
MSAQPADAACCGVCELVPFKGVTGLSIHGVSFVLLD